MKNSPFLTNVILILLLLLSFAVIFAYTNKSEYTPPQTITENTSSANNTKNDISFEEYDTDVALMQYENVYNLYPDKEFKLSSKVFQNGGNFILCKINKESFTSPEYYSSFKGNDTGDIFYPTDTTPTLDDKPSFISVNSQILNYRADRSKALLDNLGNTIFEDAQNEYAFTWLCDKNGDNVFEKDGLYYRFDSVACEFVETEIPAGDVDFLSFTKGYFTPALLSYNSDDTHLSRINKDGYVGYNEAETEIIPAKYKISFGFVNGFVALSDFETVHIYNENGERILEEFDLVLPEKSSVELLGYYRLRNGLMRICVLDEVTQEKIEKVIYITGEEYTFEKPYDVISYSDGIFLVKENGLYKYISTSGKPINSKAYTFARPFCEGVAVVADENGKLGAINTRGILVIPFEYDKICDMSGGVMTAYSNENHWDIINKLEKF